MQRNRDELKDFFKKGDIPTQSNFADLIDSVLIQKDDKLLKPPNDPLTLRAIGDDERVLLFSRVEGSGDRTTWQFSQKPTGVTGSGLAIGDPAPRLYLESGTGNMGIGTVKPLAKVHIAALGDALLLQPDRMGANDVVRIKFADPDGGTGPMAIEYRDTGRPALWVAGGDLNVAGPPNGGATLNVLTGGAGTWNKFVVNTTNLWGDAATQYVTIGAGGAAGIMIHNPHVVWSDNRASIRYGRSGGSAPGQYWDLGARAANAFSLWNPDAGIVPLHVDGAGRIGIHTQTPVNFAGLQVGRGAIVPTAGNAADAGLMWPRDPGGGSGDAAWIRYYPRAGEAMTLEIGSANDADDHIALMPSGGVGIGINEPRQKLEVHAGYIVQSAAVANNAYARQFLAKMPNGTLLVGGPWDQWLYFYFRTHDGRLFHVRLQGDPNF